MDTLNKKIKEIPEDVLSFLVKNGKRSSVLLGFDFEDALFFSWGLLKEKTPELLSVGDLEALYLLMLKERGINIFKIDVARIELKDAVAFYLWIFDELKSINELEKNYLQSSPDFSLVKAGIANLEKFGHLTTIDSLAKGDLTKYESIKKMPYNVIFDKLFLEKTKSEIEKKIIETKK